MAALSSPESNSPEQIFDVKELMKDVYDLLDVDSSYLYPLKTDIDILKKVRWLANLILIKDIRSEDQQIFWDEATKLLNKSFANPEKDEKQLAICAYVKAQAITNAPIVANSRTHQGAKKETHFSNALKTIDSLLVPEKKIEAYRDILRNILFHIHTMPRYLPNDELWNKCTDIVKAISFEDELLEVKMELLSQVTFELIEHNEIQRSSQLIASFQNDLQHEKRIRVRNYWGEEKESVVLRDLKLEEAFIEFSAFVSLFNQDPIVFLKSENIDINNSYNPRFTPAQIYVKAAFVQFQAGRISEAGISLQNAEKLVKHAIINLTKGIGIGEQEASIHDLQSIEDDYSFSQFYISLIETSLDVAHLYSLLSFSDSDEKCFDFLNEAAAFSMPFLKEKKETICGSKKIYFSDLDAHTLFLKWGKIAGDLQFKTRSDAKLSCLYDLHLEPLYTFMEVIKNVNNFSNKEYNIRKLNSPHALYNEIANETLKYAINIRNFSESFDIRMNHDLISAIKKVFIDSNQYPLMQQFISLIESPLEDEQSVIEYLLNSNSIGNLAILRSKLERNTSTFLSSDVENLISLYHCLSTHLK